MKSLLELEFSEERVAACVKVREGHVVVVVVVVVVMSSSSTSNGLSCSGIPGAVDGRGDCSIGQPKTGFAGGRLA